MDRRNLRSFWKFIWPLCRAIRARGSAMAGLVAGPFLPFSVEVGVVSVGLGVH